ncbi:MAG: saccharopine dehydrogenase C-terminal domain-containing protein [Candidatus Zixiibacteriota bacterium]
MKFAVVGAGLMGRAVVYDLARAKGVSEIIVYDIDEALADAVAAEYGDGICAGARLDASQPPAENPFAGCDAVVSAVTYKYNPALTRLAISARAHFFDLGGNNDVVAEQFELHGQAKEADVVVIPDCGLAPGMVSVLAAAGVDRFEAVHSLKIRVGGLPQNPRPPLNYQMVFSAEGLINEYWEPVVILREGVIQTVEPMSAIEELEFTEIGKLEAFYTSGGTSTLPQTYLGRIDFLDYKTIRYPGHCELFRPMLEIGLASREPLTVNGLELEPRAVFRSVLDRNLSFGEPDLALVRLDFEGRKDGVEKKLRFQIVDREDEKTGLTAMMRCTSFPVAIIAWMAAAGKISARGVQAQELAVDPDFFMAELRKRDISLEESEQF